MPCHIRASDDAAADVIGRVMSSRLVVTGRAEVTRDSARGGGRFDIVCAGAPHASEPRRLDRGREARLCIFATARASNDMCLGGVICRMYVIVVTSDLCSMRRF